MIFGHMKQLTPISKSLHFNAFSSSYLDKFSMFNLQINALLHTIKIIVLPTSSRNKLKLLPKCCVFKVRQYSFFDLSGAVLTVSSQESQGAVGVTSCIRDVLGP